MGVIESFYDPDATSVGAGAPDRFNQTGETEG